MIWQDIVITIASIIFSVALIPQVYYGFRDKVGPIAYSASIPTFIGLYVICFAFWTLSLYSSAVITFSTGTLWLILFIQRVIYHKP